MREKRLFHFSLLAILGLLMSAVIGDVESQPVIDETGVATPDLQAVETAATNAVQPETVLVAPLLPLQRPPPPPSKPVSQKTDGNVYDLLPTDVTRVPPGAQVEDTESANTNLISIVLDAVPVHDVVNMFSRISGANIIVAGMFTNIYITANLKNVDWKSAFNLALGSVNLSTIEDPSGIIMVVTSEMYKQKVQQIEETKPLIVRTYKVRYMNAVDLIEQIKLLKLLSPRGTIITSQSSGQDKADMKSMADSSRVLYESGRVEDYETGGLSGPKNPTITTAIIISDIKEYVEKVLSLIKQLDKREPQVLIEARIIDVSSRVGSKIGFDWEMLDSLKIGGKITGAEWSFTDERSRVSAKDNSYEQYDRRTSLDSLNKRYGMDGQEYEEITTTTDPDTGAEIIVRTPIRTIEDTIDKGLSFVSTKADSLTDTFMESKAGTLILNDIELGLVLSALKKDNNAEMLSHPIVMVGNRVEAKIHVGENTWRISLKKTVINVGASPQTDYSEDATELELGLKLWVIPEIDTISGIVRLTVNPEMTVFVENITTAQGSIYPVTSTRRLSTRVNVPSGYTVVIGGLVETRKVKVEKKVPVLGDIPLLGFFFRHTVEEESKHNLLIMITPTILDDNAPLTGLEAMAQQTVDRLEKIPLAPRKPPGTKVIAPSKNRGRATDAPVAASAAGQVP